MSLAKDSTLQGVSDRLSDPTFPVPSADFTPPLVPLAAGGVDVAAGAVVTLIPSNAGRVKVSVNNGGASTVWLGIGVAPAVGVGEWLGPGDRWEEFYAGAVQVRNTGSGPVRMTWMEWGA